MIAALLLAAVFGSATGPGSPEAGLRGREEFCRDMGDIYGSAAVLRDSGLTLEKALLKYKDGEVQKDALIFAYSHKNVIPYAASWYGFGVCMEKRSADDEKL